MGTIKTTNIEPIADNGTVTLGSSGDTFTIPSGVTMVNNGTQTGFGGTNTPNFGAKATSNQTGLTSGGWTKVQFDTAIFNVGSGYDTTNDKFVVPAGEGGKYFFTATAKINANSYNLQGSGMRLTGNGSSSAGLDNIHFLNNQSGYSSYTETKTVSGILNLSAGDEIEAYAYYQHISGTAGTKSGVTSEIDTYFFGYKLVE